MGQLVSMTIRSRDCGAWWVRLSVGSASWRHVDAWRRAPLGRRHRRITSVALWTATLWLSSPRSHCGLLSSTVADLRRRLSNWSTAIAMRRWCWA